MFANPPPETVQRSISPARMQLYSAFFKCQASERCLGAMLWHQSIAAALWPLICTVELVFRNRTHYALSMLHGGVASRQWYAGGPNDMKLKVGVRAKLDKYMGLQDEAGNALIATVDDFVAYSTFGIWLDVLRELHQDRRHRLAKLVFPGYGPVAEKDKWVAPKHTWLPLLQRFERHKAFRDCIAHHGPLWKIPFVPQADSPPVMPSGPGALLLSLRREATELATSVAEMDPNLAGFWEGPPRDAFLALTTLESLKGYMQSAEKA